MQRAIDALAAFVVNRPRTTWLLLAAFAVPAMLGWTGTSVLERPAPSWTTREEDERLWNAEENFEFPGWPTVLVLESDDFFTAERLRAVRRLVDALHAHPAATRVAWIGDVPPLGGIGSLLPEDGADADQLLVAREACLAHPLVADQLLSTDGRTMIVRFMPAPRSYEAIEAVAEAAREALDGCGIRARVTGTLALHLARRASFRRDHVRVQVTAYVLVLVLALVVFRGPSAMLVAASGPLVAGLLVMGWLKFLGEPANELTDIILPVLVLMIGFTDGVHLVVHLRREIAAGAEPADAARSSIREVGLACLLTSVTTAIGFASLTIARSEVVQAFGRASAVGVLVTFLAVVVVIPLLGATSLGRRIARGTDRDLVQRNMPRLMWIVDAVLRRTRLVAVAGIVATLLLAAIAFTLRPDDRLAHRVPHGSEAFTAMRHCDETFGGVQWISAVIEWDVGTDHAEVWRALVDVEAALDAEPATRAPLSIRHVLAVVPGEEGPARLGLAPLVPEEVRKWFWRPRRHLALVAARVRDDGIAAMEPVYEALGERFDDIGQQTGTRITLTGQPIVVGTAVRRVVRDLLDSLVIAGVIILAVMTLTQRSIGLGLISVVPNLFPLVVAASLRALSSPSLDVASACSFVICLGIAVDDTIHFLVRVRTERSNGATRDEAIRTAFLTVGGALVMTTLVLVAGFGCVLASDLPTHRYFATMAAGTVGAALLGDLVILPALLAWTSRDRAESGESPPESDAPTTTPGSAD